MGDGMTKTCPHAASGCNYPEGDCPGHCASKQQSAPLQLADSLENELEGYDGVSIPRTCQDIADKAAAELRRLYAENADFRATCDHLTRENARQIGEIVALKWQRDELLEALQNIAGYLDDTAACNSDKAVAAIARAAIAKAKGAA